MKTRHTIASLLFPLLAFVGAPCLSASGGAAEPASCCENGECSCAQARGTEDLNALERFLDMSDEQLERIQQAIARVRAMSPEERTALHEKLHSFRQLPPAQRERLRAGWRDNRDQADWPAMMRSLPDAERAAIQTEIQALAPTERAARKHALLEQWRSGTVPGDRSD